jgi:two-component system CitB family sensor kinase
VVLLSGAVHAWLTYERLGREAENQALTLARTVASDPSPANVQAISRQAGTPPPAELKTGPLMAAAEGARARTGALFVVITDETGLRLAHPDADRLGERVSTDPSEALAGREMTTRNTGTLGPSAGAKVPVFAPGSGSGSRTVVGEVSVGYSTESIGKSLARDIVPIVLTAGRLAGRRRPGLIPAPAPAAAAHARPGTGGNQHLVHDQVAVLEGVDDGVIGIAADGRISRVQRRRPATPGPARPHRPALGRTAPVRPGSRPSPCPTPVRARLWNWWPAAGPRSQRPQGAAPPEDLGWVVMLSDRTELQHLTRQLDAVGTMSTALRAQRHEFANQLHTIAGFMSIGQHQQARDLP